MEYVHGNVRLGYWPVVANRLYYAAYYAVTALLIKDGLSAQTHHGVIHMFNLHYIKTGKLDSKYGRLYGRLFTLVILIGNFIYMAAMGMSRVSGRKG